MKLKSMINLRKDAEPIKGGGLYKTGMSKKVMGDRKVRVRRDMDAFWFNFNIR